MLNRIIFVFETFLKISATFVLAAIIANTVSGVVARYGFNSSFLWTEELGGWLFLWLVSIGVAANIKEERQLKISILQIQGNGKLAKSLAFTTETIVFYTLLFLLLASYQLVQKTSGVSIGLQVPAVIQYAPIPITTTLAIVYAFLLSVHRQSSLMCSSVAMGIALLLMIFANPIMKNEFYNISPSLIMGVSFCVSLLLGVPIAIAMLFGVFLSSLGMPLQPPAAVVMNMSAGIANSLLLAIPLFLTAGYLMNLSGLTSRLMAFASAVVGHLRGGLAQVNVLTSVMFGAMSGSSSADAAGTTKILVPEMVKRGYPIGWSCAVTASTSVMANIMPPAISLLLYAAIADVSVGRLFLAGIVPALTIGGVLSGLVYIASRRRHFGGDRKRGTLSEASKTFVAAVPAFVLPVLIIGGIRVGIVTPTEAGGVGVCWGVVVLLFSRSMRRVVNAGREMIDCALDASSIGFLIAAAVPFAWVLTGEQVPQVIIRTMTEVVTSPILQMIICILFVLLMGTVIEMTPGMLIAVPLLLPIVEAAGVDKIHFGVVIVVALLIGGLTPPVGILVFVTSAVARIPAHVVFREIIPFVLTLIAVLAVLLVFPALTMFLAYM